MGTSKDSEVGKGFPPYSRSHLRSNTYNILVHIFSHVAASSTPTQQLQIPDDGSGGMGQEKQQKEPECSEFVGSDFKDLKNPVPDNEKQNQEVHEAIEGVEDKGRELNAGNNVLDDIELMMGIEKAEDSLRRQVEAMPTQVNGSNMEQRLMDESELVVKGNEDLVYDNGLIPLNSGLDEKQSASSEADLMDYEVEHVEFENVDVNNSGNADKLQVQGELNQLVTESFHPSLMVNVATSTKGRMFASAVSTSSIKHDSQQKEMESAESVCAAMGSFPTSEDRKFEKEEQCGQKVSEAMHLSFDVDVNMCEDSGLLDSAILEDKHEMWNEEEKLETVICANNAADSSNNPIENGDIEEGEISTDFGMDGNSFDMSFLDYLNLQQKNINEVQEPKTVVENIIVPCTIGNGEKEEGYESNSFIVNTLQDGHNSGQVEPSTSDKNGIACGVEVAISPETIKCNKPGECGSMLKPGNSKDTRIASKGVAELPSNFAENQVLHRVLLEVDASNDHGNSSAGKQKVDISSKKKCGPGSEERKARKKLKRREKHAEMNRQHGVKRLKLLPPPVQKPKTVTYCRHFIYGRCHEGSKCHFSHDTEPLTKSKPCCHFARHSCMKGDDCSFDHQLSKYSCTNFVSSGSCSRGDACMFSHQVPTDKAIPTPSNVSKPELKSPSFLSGNTNFSKPLNDHGCSPVQLNPFSNSTGIRSHINAEHKVTSTVQKQPMPLPKGISFLNVANSSLLSPSTLKQGPANKGSHVQVDTPVPPPKGVSFLNVANSSLLSSSTPKQGTANTGSHVQVGTPTPPPKGINFLNVANSSLLSSSTPKQGTANKGSHVQVGTGADPSASGTNQTLEEIPMKLPAVTPKGIKFLSFGEGSVCSFKSSISSLSNRENGIKLPQLSNFGFLEKASSSLNKDDCSKVSNGTKRSVPQTDLFFKEILDKNQSVAAGMKLNFPGVSSRDDARTDLQFNSHGHGGDHSHSTSVQEDKKASDNSQASTVTSSMLLDSPFASPNQSSELLASGYHKYASNSGQRAILSTLAFAAEHESDIKMKDPSGASSV